MKSKNSVFWIALIIVIISSCISFFLLYKGITLVNLPKKTQSFPQPVSSDNIFIYEPHIGDLVGQVFQIQGSARAFENVVSIRIKNPITNIVYLQDTVSVNSTNAGKFGSFTYTVDLGKADTLKSNEEIMLEVYQSSPKDGSEIDTVSLPLRFSPH